MSEPVPIERNIYAAVTVVTNREVPKVYPIGYANHILSAVSVVAQLTSKRILDKYLNWRKPAHAES